MAIPSLLLCMSWINAASAVNKLQELFSWNVLDWSYPNDNYRSQAIEVESLIPENAIPVGIEKWKNKLFITVPRWMGGIPATLNYIPLDAPYEPTPKLIPYPSFEGNELGNCDYGLNTVYRIKADKCDRLWVLDVGLFGYSPNVTNLCPYTLHVYDLNSNERIRKYVFKSDDIMASSIVTNIALDVGDNCTDAFAYFSDELGYGLIVYSWEQNKSWRFSHSYFMPDPLLGNYNISGLVFNWGNVGIFGIALSPIEEDGYRKLYFSPLSSHTEFSVSTRILRNESNVKSCYKDFELVGKRGASGHISAKAMDDSGVQLFSFVDKNALGCWSAFTSYKEENLCVVDKDDVNLIFPSDLKLDEEKNLWVLSNRMPLFVMSELDYGDINFRVFTAPLNTLIEGTVCEPPVQVFPNSQLSRSYTEPPSNLERKPKHISFFSPTLRRQVPAGIHSPKLQNTTSFYNLSIIVSAKTLQFEVPNIHHGPSKDETTAKMIIYVNSPDFSDRPTNLYETRSKIKHAALETKKYKSFPTTTITNTPHKQKKVKSYFNKTTSLKSYNKNHQISNKIYKKPLPQLNGENKINHQKFTKILATSFKPRNINNNQIPVSKIFVNLPTVPITNNKNNPYLKKANYIYKTINNINFPSSGTNIYPTVINYENDAWFTGNFSNYNNNKYVNVEKPIVEYVYDTDESNTENQNLINPTFKNNDHHISDLKLKNSHLKVTTIHEKSYATPQTQLHHPNRRQEPNHFFRKANNFSNHYKTTNFTNASNPFNGTLRKLDYKPFKPSSFISKRITNTADLYKDTYSKDKNFIGPPKRSKSNYNIKVNVLYAPTTMNAIHHHPKTNNVMHEPNSTIEEIYDK